MALRLQSLQDLALAILSIWDLRHHWDRILRREHQNLRDRNLLRTLMPLRTIVTTRLTLRLHRTHRHLPLPRLLRPHRQRHLQHLRRRTAVDNRVQRRPSLGLVRTLTT